ncbi:adenine phosphoribosyltransferase [Candidatus Sumerlaeota bacterium]|nr:adenine phosphoribosyltransferase [Candidatus Sumerlaeota bacterium]
MDLTTYIRDIPDFPKPGIIFKDITPLLNDSEAFKAAIQLFVDRHSKDNPKPDRIVGIESRGFIFATAVSYALGCGLVLARKPGKLPHKSISESYDLEYGSNTLEIHEDAIAPGENVVILDDLLATGGTLAATCRLVERLGGKITAVGTLIELSFLGGRGKLGGWPYYSFIKY